MAGKDCTFGLAKMSFEQSLFDTSQDHKLSAEEQAKVLEWKAFLDKKYKVVGQVLRKVRKGSDATSSTQNSSREEESKF